MDSCLALHIDNPIFIKALNQRCEYDNIPNLKTKSIAFTHLPKVGGTVIKSLLQKSIEKHRFVHREHMPYILTQALFDKSSNFTMITIFRNPIIRALSYYYYITKRQELPNSITQPELQNFWMTTMKMELSEWLNREITKQILIENTLQYFISNIPNPSNVLLTSEKWKKIQYNKNISTKSWINISQRSDFTSYIVNIPEKYQCKLHLDIVLLLLERYAVVGVYENMTSFWKGVYRRVGVIKQNAHTFMENRNERYGKKMIQLAFDSLGESLFCEIVLWQLAGKISSKDAECP